MPDEESGPYDEEDGPYDEECRPYTLLVSCTGITSIVTGLMAIHIHDPTGKAICTVLAIAAIFAGIALNSCNIDDNQLVVLPVQNRGAVPANMRAVMNHPSHANDDTSIAARDRQASPQLPLSLPTAIPVVMTMGSPESPSIFATASVNDIQIPQIIVDIENSP